MSNKIIGLMFFSDSYEEITIDELCRRFGFSKESGDNLERIVTRDGTYFYNSGGLYFSLSDLYFTVIDPEHPNNTAMVERLRKREPYVSK